MRQDDIEFLKREVAEEPESINDIIGREPRRAQAADHAAVSGRTVQWVRAGDLLSRAAGEIASRGLDHGTELSRRLQALPVTRVRSVADRVRRLPPLSAFGRLAQDRSGLTQSSLARD
ncbi:hypothetical protein [Microlunatus sp. GCM10028923]|uniref:hypothetical protein n=1 Tax=Microlunatus sp. GCM10028923 TaxID=3273400 RepID=UPI00361E6CE0